ncbi:sensor histidine kinase [Candidatus Leptofilum sp.]|uniref:sensor histidine kinase n=1 Tax=Candidatus Leptofilum sp. TaxID=3241576 RepID=UPI003B5A66FD
MSELVYHIKRRPITAVFLTIPIVIFVLLRSFPALDIHAWSLSWYTRLIQYYFGAFASFIALIAALFANSALGEKTSARSIFLTIGFIALSALFLFSSLATPNVLIEGASNPAFIWSIRLSLPVSGLFFAASTIDWPPAAETFIVRFRRLLWLAGLLMLLIFGIIAFGNPTMLTEWMQYDPLLPNLLGAISITLLLWTAWRARVLNWYGSKMINGRLAVVFLLLAQAQFSMVLGVAGQLSWLMYHPLVIAALIVALSAILKSFQTSRDLQLSRYFAALGSILIAGLSLASVEIGFRWLNTGVGVNRTSLIPLSIAQGTLSFIVLYFIVFHLNKLITERNEALRREQHLRSELTQLIVHDLKSPLTVILSGMNLMGKESLGGLTETQKRLIVNLEKSGENILQMINDLLDVERLEAGALALQKSLTDTAQLLRKQVEKSEILASTNKQKLTFTHDKSLPQIRIDKALMTRVFANLLSNALKFTPERGRVDVHIALEPHQLVISVADSGPGVPDHERERIFEKFAQVDGGERRGAGLGLTFCKMVAEAHEGSLIVKESDLGGALFCLTLPFKAEESVVFSEDSEIPQPPFSDWALDTPHHTPTPN